MKLSELLTTLITQQPEIPRFCSKFTVKDQIMEMGFSYVNDKSIYILWIEIFDDWLKKMMFYPESNYLTWDEIDKVDHINIEDFEKVQLNFHTHILIDHRIFLIELEGFKNGSYYQDSVKYTFAHCTYQTLSNKIFNGKGIKSYDGSYMLRDYYSLERYRRYVDEHLHLLRKQLRNPTLSKEEALEALTGGVKNHIESLGLDNKELDALYDEWYDILQEKKIIIKQRNYEKAVLLKEREIKIREEISKIFSEK
jgi:hypothetical protein